MLGPPNSAPKGTRGHEYFHECTMSARRSLTPCSSERCKHIKLAELHNLFSRHPINIIYYALRQRISHMIWSDINRISSSTPAFSLPITLRRHISLFPFLKSPLYKILPWHTLEIPYSSTMLHPHVIGRGTPFTSRLPLVACRSLKAS